MAFISQRTSGSSSDSVPTSPNRLSFNYLSEEFFSLPISPTTGLTTIPLDPALAKVGKNSEDGSDMEDCFEFEIIQNLQSSSENHQVQQQEEKPQHGQDSPLMSFADELFCNGQVLPLKLPPRLQYFETATTKSSNHSSNVAFPRSQSLAPRGSFHRWSFRKNDSYDFDPFMVAIEHVRKETRGRNLASPHRRNRSLSPIRTSPDWSYHNDPTTWVQQEHQFSSHRQHNLHKKPDNGEPFKPRRSASVRPVRCTGAHNERPSEPTPITLSKPAVKASESHVIKRGGSYHHKDFRRLSFKFFLFRSASEGRADSKDKLRHHTAALRKLPPFKNPSFHSIHETNNNTKKEMADKESRKKTVIPNRTSCVFFCFSFDAKDQMN